MGRALALDAVTELTNRRISQGMRTGALPPTAGAVPSLMISRNSAWRTALISELFGPASVAAAPGVGSVGVGMLRVTTHRIGGCTLETQLNSVSERFLGLPREPSFDRDIPFNQIKRNAMPTAG